MGSAATSPLLPRTPSFDLGGRVALITGGGRGIGAAAAVALARANAKVTLVARTAGQVEAIAAALRTEGCDARAVPLDITDFSAVARFVGSAGPFDILVNSAGMNRPARLVDTTDADVEAVTALNVNAALVVAREVARGLIAAKRAGSIIMVSSQMGHVGGPLRTVYCATKHAVEGMTKALAWELGPHGIRVNTVCPTFIETELTREQLARPEFRQYVESRIALGRIGKVEDVMGAIVFLAADAAALVTGSALMVDGGWTAT